MAKNYYSILGVLPTASAEDIRGAYRNRAKELHPDYYGENSRPFLELQEAYRVLSDPIQRRNYDHDTQEFLVHPDLSFPSKVEPLRPSRSRVENLRLMAFAFIIASLNSTRSTCLSGYTDSYRLTGLRNKIAPGTEKSKP